MEKQHTEPGSDPKITENRGLESNLAMTKYGHGSEAIQSHVSDPAPGRTFSPAPGSQCRHIQRCGCVGPWPTQPVRPIEVSGINFSKL